MTPAEIEVTEFAEVDLPNIRWAFGITCDPSSLETTMVEIRQGEAAPHTTICMAVDFPAPETTHVLWWTYSKDKYYTFRVDENLKRYALLRFVLEVIEKFKEKDK